MHVAVTGKKRVKPQITKVLVSNHDFLFSSFFLAAHDLLIFNHLKEFICICINDYFVDDIVPKSTREY